MVKKGHGGDDSNGCGFVHGIAKIYKLPQRIIIIDIVHKPHINFLSCSLIMNYHYYNFHLFFLFFFFALPSSRSMLFYF